MSAAKAVLLSLPVYLMTSAAFADTAGGAYGDHGHMGGSWGGMVFGPLFGLLFIAAIAIAVVLVVRALGGGGPAARGGAARSALDILDERFARGEIDSEEYEERKKALAG